MKVRNNGTESEVKERKSMDETLRKVRQDLKDCANELCLHCGKYHFEHEGACTGCKWLAVKRMEVDQDDDG